MLFTKTVVRIMNLTAALLFTCSLTASAAGLAQTVTWHADGRPLTEAFRVIEQQTGYVVVCSAAQLAEARPVHLDAQALALDDFLRLLFRNQPLTYTVKLQTILVAAKPLTVNASPRPPITAPPPVTGVVRGPDGEPLAGVNIQVKGTKRGTTTDDQGRFTISAQPGDILLISRVGYSTQEFSISSTSAVDITLSVSTSPLDEVQIIAYGQTSKRFQTGNVTTIKAADIEKQPVNNPLLALQGRVPGLFIEQANGLPSTGVKVRIQGQNSISNGNDPFYVIDGVPYTSQLLSDLGSSILGTSGINAAGNPLNFINPDDIESIEVLKDADATAIYGSRAANGAILITTKKGKEGPTKFNFNVQQGWGQVAQKKQLLSTEEYLEMRHEALKNDGASVPGPGDYDLNGLWDTTRYTDWQKELIGRKSHYTNAQASISGGSSSTQFRIGLGYHRESSIFPGDFSDQKGSLDFAVRNVSANRKFHIQLSGSYLADINELPNTDLTAIALKLSPITPSLFNTDGSLNWMPNEYGTSTFVNPLSYTLSKYENKTQNLISSLLIGYKIANGLEFKSTFGYTNLQANESSSFPLSIFAPEIRPYMIRSASFGSSKINSFVMEPQITYNHALGNGVIEALLGATLQHSYNNSQQLQGGGYNSDIVIGNLNAAAEIDLKSSISSIYKYNAAFARVNYNWQEKYILNLTARRDGSSRFGRENRFHNFGAVGAAWIFSEVPALKESFRFLSFGKLRASYGTTGNDQIGDYSFLSLYSPLSYIEIPYQGIPTIEPTRLTNPYLQWEETKKMQFGLDVALFSERIMVNTMYYINRSSNQLLNYRLPSITGFINVTRNFPATVQNSGWELSLSTVNLQSEKLKWTTAFNLTIPKTKLFSFPNIDQSSYYNILLIGTPINITRVYHFAGVDPQTGLYQFLTADDKLTSTPDPLVDKTKIIKLDPIYYGGFQNTINYNGFQLDVLFQFAKQIGRNYAFGPTRQGNFNGGWGNQPVEVLDRWQHIGDIASYQKFSPKDAATTSSYNNAQRSSDAAYTSASYIRLKNISLSYSLSKAWIKKMHLQDLRVFMLGQNLLTVTNYKGMDPETKNADHLPPLRTITIGVNLTL
jgi:TonB-linked SusC/RagA family outer membrane protein